MPRIKPCLWFDTQALEAAEFYVSIFPSSEVTEVSHYGDGGPREAGMVLAVSFLLDGQPVTALNGGPDFTFDEAISLMIDCADQDEVDRYWDALADGGEEGRCGWLKDRFGLSWQVVPRELPTLLADPDPERAARATQAMMAMRKIDVGALRRAADGG